jgi:hypothetical protein
MFRERSWRGPVRLLAALGLQLQRELDHPAAAIREAAHALLALQPFIPQASGCHWVSVRCAPSTSSALRFALGTPALPSKQITSSAALNMSHQGLKGQMHSRAPSS